MVVVAELTVVPIEEGGMAAEIASAVEALEAFDVDYETNPAGTVIEAEDATEVFRAVLAAHEAVDSDRVITLLKVDDERAGSEDGAGKVASVERELGRPPRRSGRHA
ncbi:MAG: hypothetical protein MAG715_00949 [Methanonatronarchaeales archaeon]|nr:hypothetical protein [Methanonatronarchaeales archaeon]